MPLIMDVILNYSLGMYSFLDMPLSFFKIKHLFFHIDVVLRANLCWHISFPLSSLAVKRQWEMFSWLLSGV